jgi:NADPH-dependent glutamate synthase beta subunit-like oxidoreductase/ferredoxin
MLKLSIDNREVQVPAGATILDAAEKLGIEIPTLCYLKGREPATSCLVCLVKIGQGERLVPACATRAAAGMEVASETDEVRQARRTALELLLSDHLGDCLAPCWFACPAEMDIPTMLRQIAAGDLRGAIATVKARIALPAVLGRICPAPCEKACRRAALDAAVSICQLKQCVADVDLASAVPYRPACAAATGRRVAIVGGGPTGLAAAYYLAQHGHAVTIFDEQDRLGGRLLRETSPEVLPREVLAAEIAQITSLGIEVRTGCRVQSLPTPSGRGAHDHASHGARPGGEGAAGEAPGRAGGRQPPDSPSPSSGEGSEVRLTIAPAELRQTFDAVLLATGAGSAAQAADWGLPAGPLGLTVNRQTFVAAEPGLFAAGNAIRGKGMVVRSVADGQEASQSIHQYLSGQAVVGPPQPFSTRIGRMERPELEVLAAPAGKSPREELPLGVGWDKVAQAAGGTTQTAEPQGGGVDTAPATKVPPPPFARPTLQAARCLHCDCRGLVSCKLRRYAALYGADPRRYKAPRRPFQQDAQHAQVIYEPGKCIDCGLCVQIAAASGEKLGLTYIGRGFDVRIGVPLGHSLAEALTKVAAQCVAACPTAALAWKDASSAEISRKGAKPQSREGEEEKN